MHSSPILSRYPAYDDPATIRMLIALLRLCAALPGSVHHSYYDDVGMLYYPMAARLREQFPTGDLAEYMPDWVKQFDAASAESDFDFFVWIGKNLARTPKDLLPLYESLLAELQKRQETLPFDLDANVRHLTGIFGLDETEARLLELAACAELSSFGLHYLHIERPATKVYRALAAAIGLPAPQVEQALAANGRLARSGLLQTSFDGTAPIKEALGLSTFGKQVFIKPFATIDALFAALLTPLAPPAHASPLSWPALDTEQRTVQAILDTALDTGTPGVNILLYGAPGTGKTEFAKQLAAATHRTAYEVPYKDQDGNEASRTQRLASLHTAQCMLGRSRAALLVLDEAEDIFQDEVVPPRRQQRQRTGSKAWMNRFLETNPHPVIWITNSIEDMDPAYLRRFTFCVYFDTPDTSVRRQIAQRHLQEAGVTDTVIAAIAQRREFSPALISASARAVRLAAGKAGTQDEVVMCHLNSHAKTLRLPAVGAIPASTTRFDTAYLHVEGRFSAEQVMEAIVRRGAGTVLMSGPPGTGKTQLARSLAERLGRELLYYTASDINSKWFGESEQQVARMFARCRPQQQIIFLDEAETVLGAREDASHRGSEAVTAEFLRQLEPFPGVFLCATNHGRSIDSALIRRFTFRLEFKPLNVVQRALLLRELLALPAQDDLPISAQRALARLDGLTPGDFANVKKRFELLGMMPSLDDWLGELEIEWRAKPDHPSKAPLGFV